MDIDPKSRPPQQLYTLLTGLVVPRPIAWVTTQSRDGVVNLAPFSFFNVFGSNPPLLIFAPGNRPDGTPKDTAANIIAGQEFVVHTVEPALSEAMNESSAALPSDKSEVDHLGLSVEPSHSVKVPRLAQAAVAMECRCHSIQTIGQNRIVLGEVVWFHLRDGLVEPEKLRLIDEAYRPIGRMESPNWYCRSSDRFTLERPGFKPKG
jgi:flavin reductase (DIM6/NTAB) family NADH-FMN oxidoreductase RutF